jgi:alpha-1,6-mannosyltransferase
MHIVQLANYVHPTSGGQRRVLFELGRRYVGAGHTCTRIVPGVADRNWVDGEGVENFEIRGVQIPTAGDYRAIVHRAQLRRLLESLNPDVVDCPTRRHLRGFRSGSQR